MSRIFIDRPIFAWVIAIVVMLAGIGAITRPADRAISRHRAAAGQHPRHLSGRLGRDAREQRHADHRAAADRHRRAALFHRRLELARAGQRSPSTFEKGTDPDIAQVQVQNKVQQALSRLPQQVQQQGVRVTKSNPDFLLIVARLRRDRPAHEHGRVRLSVVATCRTRCRASRASATSTCSARRYAMRIWLDPASWPLSR